MYWQYTGSSVASPQPRLWREKPFKDVFQKQAFTSEGDNKSKHFVKDKFQESLFFLFLIVHESSWP